MKNRIYFLLLALIFTGGTVFFALYQWNHFSQTRLTPQDRHTLETEGEIVLAGDYRFPPLSFTNPEGQYSGYEADLVAALEIWLGVPIRYQQMVWSDAVEALNRGELTGITGMRITDERREHYYFTNPYWQTSYCMVFPLGEALEDILENRPLNVAMQNRSATYDYFLNEYYQADMNFLFLNHPAEAVELIAGGQADLWFENYQIARYELLKLDMLNLFDFYIEPESVGDYGIAFGADYGHLTDIFNKALFSLERDRVLTDLDRKWFGLSDLRNPASGWEGVYPTVAYFIFTLFIIITFWNRLLQLKVMQKTDELRWSEKKFRASFEGTHDAIYIATKAGIMVDCNQNAAELFGYTKEELKELKPAELYPEQQPDGSDSAVLLREITASVIDSGNLLKFEMMHRRQDGTLFWGEIALKAYRLGSDTVIQANISDITERKSVISHLEYLSMHDQLTGLYNRNFFDLELERLKDKMAYPITLISCDVDGLKLINDSLGHETGDQLLKKCAAVLAASLRNSDKLARVGGDEFCVIMPNTKRTVGEEIAQRIKINIESYNRQEPDLPLGLSLGLATAEHEGMEFKDLFRQADDRMYRDKRKRSDSIRNRVVEGLLDSLADRDNLTNGHAERLDELCLLMAQHVQLSDEQRENLVLLARIHDLGKVGIPDYILNKPGPLTEDEWRLIKEHPEKGFRIAGSSPELAGIADLILKHHERWDGQGYPLGLSGENIPLECRILALADAFDMMTSERPYAAAKSYDQAFAEIAREAGHQFDPHLAEIFIEIVRAKY